MANSSFDYSYQYQNWHQDTEESLNRDIELNIHYIECHNLLPMNVGREGGGGASKNLT
jgi:hypothetical protein